MDVEAEVAAVEIVSDRVVIDDDELVGATVQGAAAEAGQGATASADQGGSGPTVEQLTAGLLAGVSTAPSPNATGEVYSRILGELKGRIQAAAVGLDDADAGELVDLGAAFCRLLEAKQESLRQWEAESHQLLERKRLQLEEGMRMRAGVDARFAVALQGWGMVFSKFMSEYPAR